MPRLLPSLAHQRISRLSFSPLLKLAMSHSHVEARVSIEITVNDVVGALCRLHPHGRRSGLINYRGLTSERSDGLASHLLEFFFGQPTASNGDACDLRNVIDLRKGVGIEKQEISPLPNRHCAE